MAVLEEKEDSEEAEGERGEVREKPCPFSCSKSRAFPAFRFCKFTRCDVSGMTVVGIRAFLCKKNVS